MMVATVIGMTVDSVMLGNYFNDFVNKFFKILPIKENYEESLSEYLRSLQVELMGCKELIRMINNDALFITLLAILQYLIDNPECSIREVKREVFKAISICNKLKARYAKGGEFDE